MRIIQITDLHIHATDDMVNGVNTKQNFINVLSLVSSLGYDLVAITGDLCFHDGNEEVYRWIKTQLESYGINNYSVIGGNHDKAAPLAKVFGDSKYLINNEFYYFIEPNIIFLDTIKGYCNEEQLSWFEKKIKGITGINPVIFMHHPPFKSGVPHMDIKYSFQQTNQFIDICKKNPLTSFVFCGHYHNDIAIFKENINMYITPSTYTQIDMFKEEFKVYHSIPAFRIIDIDDSELKTTVRYVFD